MHKILTLLLVAFTSVCFSQTITLKGKVTATDDFPLEATTVYLTSVKDSSVIDYTTTNKNGNWELKTRAVKQPVFLKMSYTGFNSYKEKFEELSADRDFGTIKLSERATDLNEIIIEGETPPVRIKADTLEFNAASFKVRPDANVEALLKQLPGVDVDADGKITVNGKEVNQILVNGKPFFDKDGKVALQNLPADIIEKVQITDTKTKKEELSGQAATGNNASINLTIDEEKNKGYFGKIMGGYGSDDRYESSMLMNYFKGARKISVLASSNNINATGFSMNEIFDNMRGGRNSSVWMSDDGSFGINGVKFGSGQGITQSNLAGISYADEWRKGFDGSGNYFYSSANTKNRNRTSLTNFLPPVPDPVNPGSFLDNSYQTESTSKSGSDKYAHNFSTEFNIKIDSTSTIYFAPKFTKANSKASNEATQYSQKISDGSLLNDNTAKTYDENDNNSFSSNLIYNKVLSKKGRSLDINLENTNNKDDGQNFNKSTTHSYDYVDGVQNTTTILRDQLQYNKRTSDSYTAGVQYIEPITDSLQVKVGANYQSQKNVQNRDGFNYDDATGRYTAYNDALTNYLTSTTNTIRPTAGFNVRKSRFNMSTDLGTQIVKFDNKSTYMGDQYSLTKNYVLPYADANISYRFGKSKTLWIGYNFNVSFPQASQVLPVEDVSNPLYTTVGNPDLDPEKSNSVYLGFYDYDFASRSGYSIYAGGSLNDDQITTFTTVNESAISTTKYTNVSGTYNSWVGGDWNKSIKKEAHTYKIGFGMQTSFNFTKGFLNDKMYDARTIQLKPKVNFVYEYGELLTINPSYTYTYNQNNYNGYAINAASNFVHKFNLQTTTYWPKHVVFGNDFGYTYNSQIADGFKKDFYLWNSSLGYNFLKDKLLLKVKVYDLLNQNIGTSRTIGATTILDQENMVLKRYVMFSLTYKLDQFGTREKKEDGGGFGWW